MVIRVQCNNIKLTINQKLTNNESRSVSINTTACESHSYKYAKFNNSLL